MMPDAAPVLPPAPATEREAPFWGYQDLLLLIGLAVPSVIAAAAFVMIVAVAVGHAGRSAATVLGVQFLAYGFWFLGLYALLKLRYGRPFWQSLAWRRPAGGLGGFLVKGAVLALVVALLGAALRTPDIDMPIKELLRDKASVVLVGVFAVTLGPLCEELIFRGFLQPLLARSLGAAWAIPLTAALFAIPHGPQYAWSWQHVVLITLAGSAFGWVRHRTGSTLAATVMHASYNFVFFVALVARWEDLSTAW